MKQPAYITICIIAVAALIAAGVPPLGETRPVKIIEVYDGDTVVVEFAPQRARVRLLDCWAPEIRTTDADEKAKGLKARDHLKAIAEGREGVLFVPYQADVGQETTLGRVLGRVYVDGKELGSVMVQAGHATKTKQD